MQKSKKPYQTGTADGTDPWRRKTRQLWKCNSHPDNFTDESFLSELVVNAKVKHRNYWQVVFGSKVVAQQMGTVACVIALSLQLNQGLLEVRTLLVYNGGVVATFLLLYTLLCAVRDIPHAENSHTNQTAHVGLWYRTVGLRSGSQLWRGARRISLLIVGTFFLSPLLQTLTRSISSDTIVATTAYATAAHLALHDYNFAASVTDKLSGSLSLAAGIFSSVLLASRLATALEVFSQVLVSMQAYLLMPYVQRSIAATSPVASATIAVMTVSGGAMLIASLSPAAAVAYVAALAFVSLACPFWLVRADKYKAQITGPWDEAAPQLPAAFNPRRE